MSIKELMQILKHRSLILNTEIILSFGPTYFEPSSQSRSLSLNIKTSPQSIFEIFDT